LPTCGLPEGIKRSSQLFFALHFKRWWIYLLLADWVHGRKQFQMKLPNIFEKEVTPQSFSAGSVIFRQGEQGDSLYVVKSGDVDIYISDQLVETVGVDGFFGEVALLDHVPRSGTAVARTDCTLIPINERHFLFMVEETPFFAIQVLRAMANRLRRQNVVAAR
jgi:CRP/FNR family cyclic AMP-dependent transcriptional regulator